MINWGKWAFANKKLVYFLLAVMLAGGLYQAYHMSKLEDPEITVKKALVVAVRAGASAHQMEIEVTDPLEKSILSMGEVDYVESSSYNDMAIIQVEMKRTIDDSKIEECWDMLRRKVGDTSLPEGTIVQVKDDFGLVYGMFYALTGDGLSHSELSDYASLIQRTISSMSSVARVDIFGQREETVEIILNPHRMASLGVSIAEIISTFNNNNGIFYAGYYDNGPSRVRVKVSDKFNDIEQIKNMLIQGHQKDQLRMSDIATIKESYASPTRSAMTHNGQQALGIAIAAASGTDIVKVGSEVERQLEKLKNERFPLGVEYHKVFFQPERVKDALSTFFINLIESVLIVIAVLMLTMGLRSGIIIGVSLVCIVIGSFLVLGLADGSMQRVSLGAFILAMGMLVDNAIVIVDGIIIDMRKGLPREIALTSIGKRTAMPLLGATLIAIIAFLPVFLSPDTAGVYIRDLFIVLAVSLLISWILALVHVPLMAGRYLNISPSNEKEELFTGRIYDFLRSTLKLGLRHRVATITALVLLVGLSIIGYGFMNKGFFPDMTYDQLYMEYKLPEGTNSSRVAHDLAEIESYLRTRPEITDITAAIGATPARYNLVRSVTTPSLSYGELIISFTSVKSLEENMEEIQNVLSSRYPDAYLRLKRYNIMYKKYPIELLFTGPDPAILHSLADTARKIMEESGKLSHITTSWEPSVPVLEVDYTPRMAMRAGISRLDVATSLLSATGGIPIGTLNRGTHTSEIYLKYNQSDSLAIDNIENVPIFSLLPHIERFLNPELLLKIKSGDLSSTQIIDQILSSVPLSQVSQGVSVKWEDPVIPRYNGRRAQMIMCSPINDIETESARQSIEKEIENISLPAGYSMQWLGEKDARVQTMHYLFMNIPLGIILMLTILIMLFKDYRQSIIIICCVPLLAVGIVGAILLSGKTFTFCAIVGALGLVGMMIKNCIVLLDEINLEIKSGIPPHQALISSAVSRARPVIMASATTILGMIPLLSDAMFGDMAATIMGGLLFSTIATLVFVPILYAIFFKIK